MATFKHGGSQSNGAFRAVQRTWRTLLLKFVPDNWGPPRQVATLPRVQGKIDLDPQQHCSTVAAAHSGQPRTIRSYRLSHRQAENHDTFVTIKWKLLRDFGSPSVFFSFSLH